VTTPNQLRWPVYPMPSAKGVDWAHGLFTIAGAGEPQLKTGCAVHMYCANASMSDSAFCNADGDFLIGQSSLMQRVRCRVKCGCRR
jgi:homogentisate 1,2-dioxygenase